MRFGGRTFSGRSRTRLMVWMIFTALFLVSQALNPWAMLPDYAGWQVFGFPLVYYQFQDGDGYFYFNLVFFLLDILIWYLVARGIVFGHRQFTKYRIIK